MPKEKLLFICTSNIHRSRTAEDLFRGSDKYEVKSAGLRIRMVEDRSRQLVTQELIDWADRIFVMDEVFERHLTRLRERFNIDGKKVKVLGIPDLYRRGDELLIAVLRMKLANRGIVI